MSFSELYKNLLENKVVVYSSDTIPSIYGRISSYEKIRKIKNREASKPFIILTHSTEFLNKLVEEYDKKLFSELVNSESAITIVFTASKYLVKNFNWQYKTVAIRIPKLNELTNLIKKINEPIISTSYNKVNEIINEAIIVIDGWDKKNNRTHSKIYDINKKKYLR